MCKVPHLIKNQNLTKKLGEKSCYREKGGSSVTLHFENKYNFVKSIFFYLGPLLGQQMSATVIISGFRSDFTLLFHFIFQSFTT